MQFTQTYEIAIHPTGKFLYAFNLNGNTVAAFTIDSTSGVLSPISGSPLAITPNAQGDLVVDPSGKFLYLTAGPPPAMTPPSALLFSTSIRPLVRSRPIRSRQSLARRSLKAWPWRNFSSGSW
jgi:DNA-binding beta-propeller fold protein YncE